MVYTEVEAANGTVTYGGALEADELPALFNIVCADLFKPLSGQYCRLYWSLLAKLYRARFEGNPLEITRGMANNFAEELLAVSPEWLLNQSELFESLQDLEPEDLESVRDERQQIRAAARRLVMRLQRSGWYYFEFYKDTGEVLGFHPGAARILSQMMSVARDEQPVLRGYAHAVASMLRPEEFVRSPGVTISTVKQQTLEFARELRILHGNIRESISKLFREEMMAADVLEETFNKYRDRVGRNYHQLKTKDNIFGWRADILRRLNEIEQQDLQMNEAAQWYQENTGASLDAATELVFDDLELVRSHVESMPKVMKEIDERNQRFSSSARRRIAYLLKHDGRMEGQLQLLIDKLASGSIPPLELQIYRAEFLSDDFLYVHRSKRKKIVNAALLQKPALDDAMGRSLLMEKLASGLNKKMISKFVLQFLGTRHSASIRELELQSDDDYLRILRILSYAHEPSVPYTFEALSCADQNCLDEGCEYCRFRCSVYSVPNGRLMRRA
jgi:hypothetical protein